MSKRIKEEVERHIHLWSTSVNDSQQLCTCGAILISQAEFDRRNAVWEVYFAKVRETRSYKRFLEQKEALKMGNLGLVKELAAEAVKELKTKAVWLQKPSFPDTNWPKYVVRENAERAKQIMSQ